MINGGNASVFNSQFIINNQSIMNNGQRIIEVCNTRWLRDRIGILSERENRPRVRFFCLVWM